MGKRRLDPKDFGQTTGIILGAAVWENGPSPTLSRRTKHGAALFHKGRVQRLVVCGGLGQHPPNEAEAMSQILQTEAVPRDAIDVEDRSSNTGENIANAKKMIGDIPVVIITDWYHAPRARLIAQRAGFSRVSCAIPKLKGAHPWPQIKGALREIPAHAAYFLGFKS